MPKSGVNDQRIPLLDVSGYDACKIIEEQRFELCATSTGNAIPYYPMAKIWLFIKAPCTNRRLPSSQEVFIYKAFPCLTDLTYPRYRVSFCSGSPEMRNWRRLPDCMNMFKIDQFSAAILDLNAMAREVPVDQYQHDALALIQKLVPFDTAWWGIMSPHAGDFILHSSHLFNLSASFVPLWEDTKCDDNVAKAVWKQPRRTFYFDERKLAAAPGLAELTGAHHIGQAFCTSHVLGTENTFTFLSLYRERNAARFTADERLLKQYLMPHLCSSWWANRAIQIERFKSLTANSETALSLIDRQLEIVNIEAGFRELLQAEWPGWSGMKLPGAVLDWLKSEADCAKFSRIVLQRRLFADFWLISVRERSRVDLLSKREASIADAFSRGLSYKEIARELGSAPATVRHHLRGIYEKLGVSDKATMTFALHEQNLRPAKDRRVCLQ